MKILLGINFQKWFKLIWENQILVKLSSWISAFFLTLYNIRNSFFIRIGKRQFHKQMRATQIDHPPIFIFSHWRNRTTLLHKLLSLDPKFIYLNLSKVYNPEFFLTLGPKLKKYFEQIKATILPLDNIIASFDGQSERSNQQPWKKIVCSENYGLRVELRISALKKGIVVFNH